MTEIAKQLAKEMNSEEIYLAIKRTQQHLVFLKSVLEAKTDIKIDEIVKESTSSWWLSDWELQSGDQLNYSNNFAGLVANKKEVVLKK